MVQRDFFTILRPFSLTAHNLSLRSGIFQNFLVHSVALCKVFLMMCLDPDSETDLTYQML